MRNREREAARLLGEAGFPGATVTASGHQGDIAAVRIAPDRWDALLGDGGAEAIQALKGLGFRYVALDLAPAG